MKCISPSNTIFWDSAISWKAAAAGYPSTPFWERAKKYGNTVILGVDAHAPAHLDGPDIRALALERLHTLGYPVIDRLPMDQDY